MDFKGKFFLTGSADIFKSAKSQEALPGHMSRLELYPLSLSEKLSAKYNIVDTLCNKKLDIQGTRKPSNKPIPEFIIEGGYPEPNTMTSKARTICHNAYINGKLLKDFSSIYSARGD